jgi:Holliday junction resolvasome RuvABC DNA-binding subunit
MAANLSADAPTAMPRAAVNIACAERLREAAALLEAQGANPFRVSAYRRAADTLRDLKGDIGEVIEREGAEGLEALPGIGRGIAGALVEMWRTGRWAQLERLRGSADPVQLFTLLPGLGHRLAERIHDELHVDTLEALEVAAYDGRLDNVPGVGPRRAAAIRASLQAMLSRGRMGRAGRGSGSAREDVAARRGTAEPSIEDLLAVDRLYREKAARGDLPTIAPKRFNPSGEAWLPVLHVTRNGRHYTALYSNTALAHQLDRTRDWVVLFFYDDDHVEGQHTIVTETHGLLAGRRVVRSREAECLAHYSG